MKKQYVNSVNQKFPDYVIFSVMLMDSIAWTVSQYFS